MNKEHVKISLGQGYQKNGKDIFFLGLRMPLADAETFQVFENQFAKDKHRVFYREHIFNKIDSVTFGKIQNNYHGDKNYIFYGYGLELEGADPATFRVLDGSDFSLDANHVYYKHMLLENMNPHSFRVIGKQYARDKESVIFAQGWRYYRLTEADPDTFNPLQGGFSKDKFSVFWIDLKIPDAGPGTFRILSTGYHTEAQDYRHSYKGSWYDFCENGDKELFIDEVLYQPNKS